MAITGPEPLTATHDVSEFSCGKPSLDRWLKARGLSNQEKRRAQLYGIASELR